MANFPYGIGLASFLDSYNAAEQRALQGRQGELREALALHQLTEADRAKRKEEQVLEALTRDDASRRGALLPPTGLQVVPGGMPAVPGMEAEAALAGVTAGPPIMPGPSRLAPPLSTLSPEMAMRVRAHPTGERVLKSLEESEKEQERQQRREEARTLRDVATERFKANDRAGGLLELAKALDRVDQWAEAGKLRDTALALQADKEEDRKSGVEYARVLKAIGDAEHDPSSLEVRGELHKALGGLTTKTNRPLRDLHVNALVKEKLGKDVYAAILSKEMLAESQKTLPRILTSLEQVQAVHKRDPQGTALVERVLGGHLRAGQFDKLAAEFFGFDLTGDPGKNQTTMAQAITSFQQQFRRSPKTQDDWSEVGKIQQRLKAAAESPEQKELEQLKLEGERYEQAVRQGKVEPNLEKMTLFAQRAAAGAAKADDIPDEALAESYRTVERHWVTRSAEKIKKQPGGAEFGKPLPGTPDPRRAKELPAKVDQEAALTEMRRLIKAGHTKQTAIEAMKQLGWPVK